MCAHTLIDTFIYKPRMMLNLRSHTSRVAGTWSSSRPPVPGQHRVMLSCSWYWYRFQRQEMGRVLPNTWLCCFGIKLLGYGPKREQLIKSSLAYSFKHTVNFSQPQKRQNDTLNKNRINITWATYRFA